MNNITQLQYFYLYQLIKHKELTAFDLINKAVLNFNVSLNEAELQLKHLISKQLAEETYEYTNEYKACIEREKNNKRIKDVKTYCMKKHPIQITLKITQEGINTYLNYFYKLCRQQGNTIETCIEEIRNIEKKYNIKSNYIMLY